MKAYRLVRQSQVLTVLSPADAERMLATGDYVVAAPKQRTKDAARMRGLRRQRQEAGWSELTLWLDPDQLTLVKAAKLPAESYAALFVRLLKERDSYVNDFGVGDAE